MKGEEICEFVKVQMLLSSIVQIPHLFLRHSSTTPLRIRSICSSSSFIKVSIKLFSLSLSYPLLHFPSLFMQMASQDYTFGPYKIHHNEVFYSTDLSYAMVNLRPLLPGNNAQLVIFLLFIHWFTQTKLTRFGYLLHNNKKKNVSFYCIVYEIVVFYEIKKYPFWQFICFCLFAGHILLYGFQ